MRLEYTGLLLPNWSVPLYGSVVCCVLRVVVSKFVIMYCLSVRVVFSVFSRR